MKEVRLKLETEKRYSPSPAFPLQGAQLFSCTSRVANRPSFFHHQNASSITALSAPAECNMSVLPHKTKDTS